MTQDLSIHSKTQERTYVVVLGAVLLLLASVYPLLAGSSYRGSADLHASIETIGSLFGLVGGLALIVRFYTLGNRFHLFIGLALFVNGAEDLVHGLLAFLCAHEWAGGPTSSLQQFIPGTYVTGRLLMGVILLLAPFMPALLGRSSSPKRETILVSSAVLLATAGATSVTFLVPLPQFVYPERFVPRPVDALSAIVLLTALAVLLREYRRHREPLTMWICLSVGINIVGQLMMSFSKELYDPFFDVAHVYKVFGYVTPLFGFCLCQVSVIRDRCRVQEELRLSNQHLAKVNSKLESTACELKKVMESVATEVAPGARFSHEPLMPCREAVDCSQTDCPALSHEGDVRCLENHDSLSARESQTCASQGLKDPRECSVYLSLGGDALSDLGETFNDMLAILERKQKALSAARAEAEAASLAKSSFLANMSHEIRTPMNGVVGAIGLLCNTDLTQEQKQLAEMVRGSSDALLTLLDDILDFSKIEAGKLDIEAAPVDLVRIVHETVELFRSRAAEKRLLLRVDYSDAVPRYVVADGGRIRQVLANFVGNAVKFTEKGHVAVTVTCEERSDAEARLRVSTEDSGIGIPEKAQQMIFDKFSQADISTTRRFGGTGLGLAINRHLVTLMGGTVGLASCEGEGSSFWFLVTLPLCEEIRDDREPAEEGSTTLDARILLVEDNRVNQIVARRQLERHGCVVEVASDGREALAMLQEESYDVVFMDCHMPVMDGFEATRAIRALEGDVARVPIIAMTASAMQDDRRRCLDAGMDDFIAKPVNEDALKSILERWLAKARSSCEAELL